jgi:pre-rRNA-processing protein IPI1
VPLPILLPKILPLVVDQSASVRAQLLSLLKALPSEDVSGHVEKIALFIQSAMTHLAADVRADSTAFLGWLLETAGHELVSTVQGWVKTTKCFLALFGWEGTVASAGSSGQPTFRKLGGDSKSTTKHLQTLRHFLTLGILLPPKAKDEISIDQAGNLKGLNQFIPSPHTVQHLLPKTSNCFAYLGLFGTNSNHNSSTTTSPSQQMDEVGTRRGALQPYQNALRSGLAIIIKDGGETGRIASSVDNVLEGGLASAEVEIDLG